MTRKMIGASLMFISLTTQSTLNQVDWPSLTRFMFTLVMATAFIGGIFVFGDGLKEEVTKMIGRDPGDG